MPSPLSQRAHAVIPGGVNSPVRAFKSVGGDPFFAERAEGPWLHTTDGRKLLDFCLSFGPMILGHADPDVQAAMRAAVPRGTSYAVTTEAEIELAELITNAIPVMDKVRLVNSGTEAVMTALRIARGATGRSRILKFSGCYHGHTDSMLVQAGSGVAGIAAASSAGVTAETASDTLVAPFHDREAVEALVREHGNDLAAIVVEPIPANMGLVLPEPGFLKFLREQADRCGALMISDEVITGFRVCFGAFANICCAKPDLITLGKIIGGGMPIGAVGGRADLMDHLAPNGPVYQAGTLSGNPFCVAAGLATLRKLRDLDPYDTLEQRTTFFANTLRDMASKKGVALSVPSIGSLYSTFFRPTEPRNFDEVSESDAEAFRTVFHSLLVSGVYVAPSAFEAGFLSTTHGDREIAFALEAWERALALV